MIDPVTLAVIRGRLEQIVDEMDATLFRAAFSPVIADAIWPGSMSMVFSMQPIEEKAPARFLAILVAP